MDSASADVAPIAIVQCTVDDAVRRELESLLGYATGVGRHAAREPERTDIVDGGRGYIGGALTTLHHLGLVTDDEHREWWDRLMDKLPPTNWIGG
jgi:hypothetical protein